MHLQLFTASQQIEPVNVSLNEGQNWLILLSVMKRKIQNSPLTITINLWHSADKGSELPSRSTNFMIHTTE